MADKSNPIIREKVISKYDFKCAYCGCDITIKTLHIDHINPLMRGSRLPVGNKNNIENFNPSCAPCNISKSTMDIETWRNELQLKINRIERDSATFRNLKRFGLVEIIKHNVEFYFEK